LSRFTPETIERVREAADIVEIVSGHSDLRRQGERFTGLCPFHEERTPSFSVKPAEGFYYCFGCEAGGDAIRFVQEKEGLSFPDAVESLAERYGVEIERESEDPQAEAQRKRRARLIEALERAAAFYDAYLWGSREAGKAREYLQRRGLGEEVLRSFGVGYAPSAWDSILVRGQRAGFALDELRAVGLVQASRKGGFYDAFRSRITFPIRDIRGRALGFGARAMGDGKPKYKNSSEGEIYRKSRTLYGIDRARAAIARGGQAVVVEGYTDVLALHQAGIESAVAVMGTAITPEQLKMLSGYAEEVVLALDADRAGREAMLRAERVAGAGKLRLHVAAMPAGEDPAEMLAEGSGGGDRFRALVDGAVELAVFHARAILDDGDLSSPGGRDRALDDVAPVLAAMGETITRQELLREVADRLDTDPALVVRRMGEGPRGGGRPASGPAARPSSGPSGDGPGPAAGGEAPRPPARQPPARATPEQRREEVLLAMCIAAPGEGAGYLKRLEDEHLSSERSRKALRWLREHLADPLEGLPREDEELFGEITRLRLLADREPASAGAMELSFLVLERGRIEREISRLRGEEGADPNRAVALQRERARVADAIASRSV
jgi:DNA primase